VFDERSAPVAGGPDADQTQRMVALLIDGLRYAGTPRRSRAPA